jgi:hypothetical protein
MHGNAGAYATVRVTPEKIVLCFIALLLTFHLGSALAPEAGSRAAAVSTA